MLLQEFRPLLPKQRLAAGKACIEMEVNATLRRVETGNATASEARVLQHAFAILRGNTKC